MVQLAGPLELDAALLRVVEPRQEQLRELDPPREHGLALARDVGLAPEDLGRLGPALRLEEVLAQERERDRAVGDVLERALERRDRVRATPEALLGRRDPDRERGALLRIFLEIAERSAHAREVLPLLVFLQQALEAPERARVRGRPRVGELVVLLGVRPLLEPPLEQLAEREVQVAQLGQERREPVDRRVARELGRDGRGRQVERTERAGEPRRRRRALGRLVRRQLGDDRDLALRHLGRRRPLLAHRVESLERGHGVAVARPADEHLAPVADRAVVVAELLRELGHALAHATLLGAVGRDLGAALEHVVESGVVTARLVDPRQLLVDGLGAGLAVERSLEGAHRGGDVVALLVDPRGLERARGQALEVRGRDLRLRRQELHLALESSRVALAVLGPRAQLGQGGERGAVLGILLERVVPRLDGLLVAAELVEHARQVVEDARADDARGDDGRLAREDLPQLVVEPLGAEQLDPALEDLEARGVGGRSVGDLVRRRIRASPGGAQGLERRARVLEARLLDGRLLEQEPGRLALADAGRLVASSGARDRERERAHQLGELLAARVDRAQPRDRLAAVLVFLDGLLVLERGAVEVAQLLEDLAAVEPAARGLLAQERLPLAVERLGEAGQILGGAVHLDEGVERAAVSGSLLQELLVARLRSGAIALLLGDGAQLEERVLRLGRAGDDLGDPRQDEEPLVLAGGILEERRQRLDRDALGVAEREDLFVEGDRLVDLLEVVVAHQSRLAEALLLDLVVRRAASLVLVAAGELGPVLGRHVDVAEGVARLLVVGADPERGAECLGRSLEIAEVLLLEEADPLVDVGPPRRRGRQPDLDLERGDELLGLFLLVERLGAPAERVDVGGLERERLFVRGARALLVLEPALAELAQHDEALDLRELVGLELGELLEHRREALPVLGPAQERREVAERRDEGRVVGESGLVALARRIGTAPPPLAVAELGVGERAPLGVGLDLRFLGEPDRERLEVLRLARQALEPAHRLETRRGRGERRLEERARARRVEELELGGAARLDQQLGAAGGLLLELGGAFEERQEALGVGCLRLAPLGRDRRRRAPLDLEHVGDDARVVGRELARLVEEQARAVEVAELERAEVGLLADEPDQLGVAQSPRRGRGVGSSPGDLGRRARLRGRSLDLGGESAPRRQRVRERRGPVKAAEHASPRLVDRRRPRDREVGLVDRGERLLALLEPPREHVGALHEDRRAPLALGLLGRDAERLLERRPLARLREDLRERVVGLVEGRSARDRRAVRGLGLDEIAPAARHVAASQLEPRRTVRVARREGRLGRARERLGRARQIAKRVAGSRQPLERVAVARPRDEALLECLGRSGVVLELLGEDLPLPQEQVGPRRAVGRQLRAPLEDPLEVARPRQALEVVGEHRERRLVVERSLAQALERGDGAREVVEPVGRDRRGLLQRGSRIGHHRGALRLAAPRAGRVREGRMSSRSVARTCGPVCSRAATASRRSARSSQRSSVR